MKYLNKVLSEYLNVHDRAVVELGRHRGMQIIVKSINNTWAVGAIVGGPADKEVRNRTLR